MDYFAGPAPEAVTNKIYSLTQTITQYSSCPDLNFDLSQLGTSQFTVDGREFTLTVIDCVQDYLELMKEIFDFASLHKLLTGADFKILINSMHGGKQNFQSNYSICKLYRQF